jgi:hypothetical protein
MTGWALVVGMVLLGACRTTAPAPGAPIAPPPAPPPVERYAAVLATPEPRDDDAARDWRGGRQADWEYLWRTGQSTVAGLCPAGSRAVPELAARARDGSIGTAHPLRMIDFDPGGTWTLLCQARGDSDGDGKVRSVWRSPGYVQGDQMSAYLVAGSGPGWPVDRLVATDPAGRFAAVRRGPCLELVDLREATAVVLPGADLRELLNGPVFQRAAAFAPDGRRMVYLRGGPAGGAVVRDLSTGAEKVVDPGMGFVRHVSFDDEGGALRVEGVAAEAGRGAEIRAPRPDCGAGSCQVFVYDGPLLRRVIPVEGGGPRLQEPLPTVFRPRDEEWPRGIWATRADGARLMVPGGQRDPFVGDVIPKGPLRWRR